MADTTKEKILKINTQGAEKNVKSLKTQIRELKEQLAQLDKGTVEYDKVSKQLADTNQKQIEINEAMKYSNKDLGATLSNLTKVSAGVVGAISSVNSVMVLMGADSEEAQEAMKKIQSLMAIIQGLSAIDTAVKALKGLTVAFKGFNDVRVKSITTSLGASGAELAEAGALADNTVKMHKNNEEAKDFNKYNDEGAEATKRSRDAIQKETEQLILNTTAKEQNAAKTQELIERLEKLNSDRELETSNAQNIGFTKAIEEYERRIKQYQSNLERYGNSMPDKIKRETQQKLQYYQTALQKILMTSTTTTDDIIVAVEGSLNSIVNNSHSSFEDLQEDVLTFNQLLKGLPFDVAQEKAQQANDFFQRCIASFQMAAMMGEEGAEDALKDFSEIQYMLGKETAATLETIKAREAEIANTERLLEQETAATEANTAATEANTAAKDKNALATQNVTNSEQTLGTATKKNDPILRKAWSAVTNGIKNAAKALKAFISANPILAGIMAAIAAIGAAIAIIADNYADAHKELREQLETQNAVNMEVKKQMTDMEALIRMFNNENTTAKEKETLAKEINKLAGEELVIRNKVTGEWELQNDKLEQYIANLKTSIALEYHKKQILESMDREEEARNDAIYERTHLIGNLFRTEEGYLEDAADEVAIQEKHWREIEKLTAGTVKNIDKENKELKKTTGGGGVKKTFKELFAELVELWKKMYNQITSAKELRKTFNGFYSEAAVAFDKILDAINANRFAQKLSKEFKDGLDNGLKGLKSTDVTLDFVFGNSFDELEKKLQEERNKLQGMLQSKKINEKDLLKQKEYVTSLEKELQTMAEIVNATVKYRKAQEAAIEAANERAKANKLYNQQLEVENKFIKSQRRENYRQFRYADLVKEIELNKLLQKATQERLDDERRRIEELRASNSQNKETIEEIAELQKKIDEDQQKVNELEYSLSNSRWQLRLTKLDEEYDKIKRNSEVEQQQIEIERNMKGGGVADYNTDVDLIERQMEAMTEYANYIEDFYAQRQALYAEDSIQWQLLEQERLAALEAIQDEYRAKELEKDKALADRKLNIQKTYIAAYQGITSQIGNILSAQMERYDENSEEYKKLKYAQGVMTTAEGVLAAFMSGIESGIPAPWNLALAAAMSGLALTAGIMQLNNIKNEKLGGSMPNTVEVGSEYDTLSYQTNVDTLSAIQDQRVYVVESDITDTQNRVEVAESSATF